MSDIKVKFVLPVDNRIVTVELDDTMSPEEIISELIAGDIIQANAAGYKLAVKGGAEINSGTQLKDLSLDPEVPIRVVPATDAGVLCRR